MTKHKLTPWFPGDVKPVHVGVYQRNYHTPENPDLVYCKWDGRAWMTYSLDVESANLERIPAFSQHLIKWRGIQK